MPLRCATYKSSLLSKKLVGEEFKQELILGCIAAKTHWPYISWQIFDASHHSRAIGHFCKVNFLEIKSCVRPWNSITQSIELLPVSCCSAEKIDLWMWSSNPILTLRKRRLWNPFQNAAKWHFDLWQAMGSQRLNVILPHLRSSFIPFGFWELVVIVRCVLFIPITN